MNDMRHRVAVVMFGTGIGLLGLFAFSAIVSEPVPAPLALSSADSSIGLPIPAYVSTTVTSMDIAGYTFRAPRYRFLRVYVGGVAVPERQFVVNFESALNVEHSYWSHEVFGSDGFVTLPVEASSPRVMVRERLRPSGEMVEIVPSVNVADLARGK